MTVAMNPVQVPEDAVRLGRGPVPSTDAELKQRVVEAIEHEAAESGATLPVSVAERVQAHFATHPNIAEIVLDLSDVTVEIRDEALGSGPGAGNAVAEGGSSVTGGGAGDADSDAAIAEAGSAATEPTGKSVGPRVVKKEEAALDRLSFRADPMRIESMPVTASFDAQNVAVDWLIDVNGDLWLTPSEDRKLEGFAGEGEARVNIDDARTLLQELVTRATKGTPVRIKEIDFDVEAERARGGEQRIHVTGVLDGRYKFIGTRVTVAALAVLENGTGKARVEDLALKASNPLMKLTLAVFRKQIRARVSEPVDLGSGLPEGYRVDHLELRTRGKTLIVAVRLA